MTGNEPESANRWATEHYGFVDDDGASLHVGAMGSTAIDARPSRWGHGGPRSRRQTTMIASAVLSVALVAGIGGTAVASDDGPGGGRPGITHLHGGPDRGDRGAGR
jgi:hypothetical protein